MARHTDNFELSEEDRDFLKQFTDSGTAKVRQIKRGLVLLKLDQGLSVQQIVEDIAVSSGMIYGLRKSYIQEGLQSSLYDKPRSGRPVQILGADRAKITGLACSDAPEGHVKWTLRLLADKAVELGYVEKGDISHTHIGRILKKMNSDPT
jgi:transposase